MLVAIAGIQPGGWKKCDSTQISAGILLAPIHVLSTRQLDTGLREPE